MGILNERFFPREQEFFPTVEEAFASFGEAERRGGMGEILFMEEFGDTLTVFHMRRNRYYLTHYLLEVRDGETWYTGVGIGRGAGFIYINPQMSNWLPIARSDVWLFIGDGVTAQRARDMRYENITRRPLYGTFAGEEVYNLSINGLYPDHIIFLREVTNIPQFEPHPLYFWYFHDFPPFFGEREDIVISFAPG